MERQKKIRGHKRIWREIDDWVTRCKDLDLNYLKKNQRDYIKVWVPPYRNISVLNSKFQAPKGKTRRKIVDGIFTIYQSWKTQLESLNEPYYLKIWYYPHDVSKNQVVCAIGDALHFYNITFFNPKSDRAFPENSMDLHWELHFQEIHVSEHDLEEPEMFASLDDYAEHTRWVQRIMQNPNARITKHLDAKEKEITYYSIKECDVWIGG